MQRPIHLLHDSRMLARMIGVEAPCCDMVAMPTSGKAEPFCACTLANPLHEDFLLDLDAPSERFLCYSGSLNDDLFADEPSNWMQLGQAQFEKFLDDTAPALKANQRRLCLRPHRRHVLGDLPGCVKFLRERVTANLTGPFELCLSPIEMLAPSMLEPPQALYEHLHRMFAHLGPASSCVLLADIKAPTALDDVERCLELLPLGTGVLDRGIVLALLEEFVPVSTPILLISAAVEQQLNWFRTQN